MKKILLMAISFALLTTVFSQDAKKFYEQGLEKAQEGELEKAIVLFDKSIAVKSDEYVVWYNRGIAKAMLNRHEEALPDFDQTLKLYPDYKKGYLNRGTTRKKVTDYEGALSDYTYAIKLDPNYADAYYNRGLVYDMLSKKDAACADFSEAKKLGLNNAKEKVDKCNDTTKSTMETHVILRLTKTADNETYGFTSANPVKVGFGPEGASGNNKVYLNLLRDAVGKPISYERIGSCCAYKSKNAFVGGIALLDHYEITYLDGKGKRKKASVYISFYDYEEPQILYGLKTVGQK
jgi:tetratricopeptide (TPR) repeat protein